jgi:arylsulfatase
MVYALYTGIKPFDIGRDEGRPVNPEYEHLGKLERTPGQLQQVVFDIE